MMKEEAHIFQGMRRDNHPIRQEQQFLWDAHNIRLTTRDDNTMLSITNEKSTVPIQSFTSESYIGHVVIGNYIILLTVKGSEGRIHRIEIDKDNKVTLETLYKGSDLNFKPEFPAQMLADYESELIQKVYWVDGVNQPRMMNIAKPELEYPDNPDGSLNEEKSKFNGDYTSLYLDHPFEFVQELKLEETVNIERVPSSVGLFPSGVIQYAFTYLHKYGQESNIFWVSEPLYLSYPDRGGSPEDRIGVSFDIDVQGCDSRFDYVRIYSIIRTSIDAVPTVKRVADVGISEGGWVHAHFTDNNTTGDTVDPTYLLYVGGKSILANCIASKDNTLFLGGITYNRKSVHDLDIIGDDFKLSPTIPLGFGDRSVTLRSDNTEYIYRNQLVENTCTFKNGETYRLGIRFQYKSGEWSEPVWVTDKIYRKAPRVTYEGITLGNIEGTIPNSLKETLINNGYRRVQPLIVRPSYKDRTVLAQGILCPTIGQVGNRVQKTGAWAQSSWILRPWNTTLNDDAYRGSIPEYRHDMSLPFGRGRNVELQTMAISLTNNATSLPYEKMAATSDDVENYNAYYNVFVVDQSIVTMHSPDIEFGDIANIINSGTSLKLYRMGKVRFNSSKGEIDVQTDTPVINPDAQGFVKNNISGNGERSLISGLFYEDSIVKSTENKDTGTTVFKGHSRASLWMTYMWHRSGSLNNDCARPEGTGTRTSNLKKKSIVNFKVSNETTFYPYGEDGNLPASYKLECKDIQMFNSNEMSLVKLRESQDKTISYYGNVDTLLPAYSQYSPVCSVSTYNALKYSDATFEGEVLIDGTWQNFSGLKATGIKGNGYSIIAGVGVKDSKVEGALPYLKPGGESVLINCTEKTSLHLEIKSGKYRGTVTLMEDVGLDGGVTIYRGHTWSIRGNTDISFEYDSNKYFENWMASMSGESPRWGKDTPQFTSDTEFVINDNYLEDSIEALKLSREGVRIKYKSTPHVVINLNSPLTNNEGKGMLYLAELRQEVDDTVRYGGTSEEALKSNLWIPAGPSVYLDPDSDTVVKWIHGDTWYQRYDCLKTYPFTFEDINQVTEIGSFYCETRVNIDGRYDRNRGSVFSGISPANFNLINPVYSQLDTFFNSRMLDKDYYKSTKFPSQFIWTGTKTPSSDTDLWTNLHMANSYDMDGSNGKLTAIQVFNDLVLGFQDKAVSQILFNSRVQIQASDGVPIEIANSQKVEGVRMYSNTIGCQDKFSMVTTPLGIYFVDNNNCSLYKFNGELNNIGLQLGTLYWLRDNYCDTTWRYKGQENLRNGIRLSYDPKHQDVYFVPGLDGTGREALCYSEQLGQFTSMMSYGGAVMFPYKSKFYSVAENESSAFSNMTLWENFPSESNNYNTIFGKRRGYSLSFISNDNPTLTKIFDTLEMRADCYHVNDDREDNFGLSGKDLTHTNQSGSPFSFIKVENEYQNTGEVGLDSANMRKKFRVWRALIPRNKNSRERIRNPWAMITLGWNPSGTVQSDTRKIIMHDVSVKYTV